MVIIAAVVGSVGGALFASVVIGLFMYRRSKMPAQEPVPVPISEHTSITKNPVPDVNTMLVAEVDLEMRSVKVID